MWIYSVDSPHALEIASSDLDKYLKTGEWVKTVAEKQAANKEIEEQLKLKLKKSKKELAVDANN